MQRFDIDLSFCAKSVDVDITLQFFKEVSKRTVWFEHALCREPCTISILFILVKLKIQYLMFVYGEWSCHISFYQSIVPWYNFQNCFVCREMAIFHSRSIFPDRVCFSLWISNFLPYYTIKYLKIMEKREIMRSLIAWSDFWKDNCLCVGPFRYQMITQSLLKLLF